MSLALAITVYLSAAATPSLAMPGLKPVNVSQEEVDVFGELLTARLAERGLKVVSARDLSTLLGLERQRQLMGCGESSCMAELVGALGAEALVVGDVASLDGALVLTLKVLRARDGFALARFDGRASNKADMPRLLAQAADALALPLGGTPRSTASGPSRWWAVVPAVLAAGAVGTGVWCELQADGKYAALQSAMDPETAQRVAGEGKNFELAGGVLLGVGGAAALTAVGLAVFGSAPDVTPSVSVSLSGAMVGATWRWP